MRIAPARDGDEKAVIALLRRQLDEHAIELPDARLESAVVGMLREATRGFVLLARDGDEPIGVAYVSFVWTLEHGGKSAWLEEIFVLPDRRSLGTGGKLLAAVLDRARAEGCAALDLEVEADHARASHLYERAGFRQHHRTRWVRRVG